MNMRVNHKGIEFVTVSSLIETPFELKLFEITPGQVTMGTISLQPELDFEGDYFPDKAFVQGRQIDREFTFFD